MKEKFWKCFQEEDIHSMSDVDLVIKEQIVNNLDYEEYINSFDLWAPQVDKIEDVKLSCFGNPI